MVKRKQVKLCPKTSTLVNVPWTSPMEMLKSPYTDLKGTLPKVTIYSGLISQSPSINSSCFQESHFWSQVCLKPCSFPFYLWEPVFDCIGYIYILPFQSQHVQNSARFFPAAPTKGFDFKTSSFPELLLSIPIWN